MQALIELFAGFFVMLAAAALAQFGVSLNQPAEPTPEVRRVADCEPPAPVAPTEKAPRPC